MVETISVEQAMQFISQRMSDLTGIYKVLNESHTDTQIRLAGLDGKLVALDKIVAEDHIKLGNLDEEFGTFMTQAKTIFKIVTYFMTPAFAISLALQVARWWADIQ